MSGLSLLTIFGMMAVTYATRLIGYYALRNRTLGRRSARMMEAAPGCVLLAVIAPYFVSDRPHELAALAVALWSASRWGMMTTVLLAVATAGVLGWVFQAA